MRTEDLKLLIALEPKWTVSVNGLEFLLLASGEIAIEGQAIRFGRYVRKINDIEWLRGDVIRIRARSKFRSSLDVIMFHAGERLPPAAEARRRRRAFQAQIRSALCSHFGVRKMERETLYSDRRYGIGGAYLRFVVGRHAAIIVDPDESSIIIDGIMRAALLWAPLARRRLTVVVPRGRHATISARLRHMPDLQNTMDWLQWNGSEFAPLDVASDEPETHVQEFAPPEVEDEVARICDLSPGLLQAIPHIAGRAVSIRLKGIEVARVSSGPTIFPLGEPLERVITELEEWRRFGSRHPLARAHEERWLESNLISEIRHVVPSVDAGHIYPQVPSFVGEERNIIDLLTVTRGGRLVVIEIKASADPDLPFQALDYWLAVERHRKANDFSNKGYFRGRVLRDEPALLVLVAPLLAYHKTMGRLIRAMPRELPVMEVGINQTWKKGIKILRRKGMVS